VSDRIFIFIDGLNLKAAMNEVFHRQSDLKLLAGKLANGRRLVKALYYDAPLNKSRNLQTYQEQQDFFETLRRDPRFELRLGALLPRQWKAKCPDCGREFSYRKWIQKGVDTLLVLDMVSLAAKNAYDVAILVCGDKDMQSAITEVKMLDNVVENAFTE
jgi:uncharacterized LabA/DUF88 family protein